MHKNNIGDVQKSLFSAYKELDSSSVNKLVYKPFRDISTFSIYTDGIQKFSKELNGSYARTADPLLNITNAPVSLHQSLNATNLVAEIISVINEIKPLPEHLQAYGKFQSETRKLNDPLLEPTPPDFFKCCSVMNFDAVKMEIDLSFDNWPACIMADGCATNGAAVNLLTEQIGILSPTARCSGHAAHGSIKRMAASKTMCVDEVVTYPNHIRPILKHFKNSGKSTSALNSALQIHEMKAVKTMTWCPTRMGNLLTASKRSSEMFVPIYDVISTCGINREEVEYFCSPQCLTVMRVLADLEPPFMAKFLKRLDADDAVIIDVYSESERMVDTINSTETKNFDLFVDGLYEDPNGNVCLKNTSSGDDILLNYTRRPGRGAHGRTKVDTIKAQAYNLKKKIMDNLKENINSQKQSDTIVEFASCFDMSRNIGPDEQVKLLENLHGIYGTDFTHHVTDEEALEDLAKDNWCVRVKYPAKVECSKEELVCQFRKNA